MHEVVFGDELRLPLFIGWRRFVEHVPTHEEKRKGGGGMVMGRTAGTGSGGEGVQTLGREVLHSTT